MMCFMQLNACRLYVCMCCRAVRAAVRISFSSVVSLLVSSLRITIAVSAGSVGGVVVWRHAVGMTMDGPHLR